MKHSHNSLQARAISLVMTFAMLLSLLVLPAGAVDDTAALADATLTLSGPTYNNVVTMSLSESGEAFSATLTVPASAVGSDAQAWAESLTWTLDREQSEQDPDLFPYCYTGDELANWQTWGTNGTDGVNYFDIAAPVVVATDDTVAITLTFTTAVPFATDRNGVNQFQISGSVPTVIRNMFESFIGMYNLSVSDGSTVLGTVPMMFNQYQSYTRYADTYAKLLEIQALAAENGRYMTITKSGVSEAGYDQYYVTFSDSAESVAAYEAMNAIAVTDPASLQAKIADGSIGEYRIPFMINNVHPDENPGVDAHLNVLYALATQDTITYNTLTGLIDGEVDMSIFDEKVAAIDGFTGLGSKKISGSTLGGSTAGNNDGITDASEFYTISDGIVLDVEELLDNVIIFDCPNENPDGRTFNARRNGNGMDLNRDASNQTQAEPYYLYPVVAQINPVIFAELHGYMDEFLVEPCTPPHEPNLEYDLLVDNFVRGAEAFGCAALGTLSAQYDYDMKFQCYYTPLRDDYDAATTTWSAWDDLCTNYGPSYAMLNCASLGYTIEIPNSNEASTSLLECGMYGLLDYAMQYKDDLYNNQLEFFVRNINNIDARDQMDMWYVDVHNNPLPKDTWRVPYAENNNYFPEYYVMPVDADSQRDPADAYEMAAFLTRNDVDVCTLTKDVTVGGVTYKAGSLVVNMAQAKRNYANAVLWEGADASNSGFPRLYSESVSNFPAMRGFDCIAIPVPGAFDGALSAVLTDITGTSQLAGSGKMVVISNNGNETVRAVNALLAAGKTVAMITEGQYKGDFLVSIDTYNSIKDEYVLVGTAVSELPVAYQISQPNLFIAGRYDPFNNFKITSGYYAEWFSNGYGYVDWRNNQQNTTSAYDIVSYVKQLNFNTVSDPAAASVIVSDVAPNTGDKGEATIAAIKAGTPYISTGSSPLNYISRNLVTGLSYQTLGQEALHTVTYPTDSIITASQVADEDYIIYSYNCAILTSVPEGAQVLIRAAEKDSFIAGCCLNDAGTVMDGYAEAFALTADGMDLTVFGNSVNNRAHQQDDYLFVTNTIYSKNLADTAITAADLGIKDDPTPVPPSGGGTSGNGSIKDNPTSGTNANKDFTNVGTTTPTAPTTPSTPSTDKVVLSNQNLTVNGNDVKCEMYNINGNNFFKLRDVAYLLNGTDCQFSVGYDQPTNTVTIVKGEAYQPIGTELQIGADKSATAVRSSQIIIINGATVTSIDVFNIGGYNYFKLRDLAGAIGFTVAYDEVARTVQIG